MSTRLVAAGAGEPSDGQQKQIKHGQFTIAGQHGHAAKKYVLVPEGEVLNKAIFDQIFKAWKLRSPNLCIWVKSGAVHPTRIVGNNLAKTEQFKNLVQTVEGTIPEDGKGAQATGAKAQTHALQTVNKILANKLNAVMDGICNAADQTNSWVVIVGPPAQGEVVLEDALGRSGASPVILVIDNLANKNYCASDYSRAMSAELDRMAVPLGTPAKKTAELRGDLWDPAVNTVAPPDGKFARGHEHFLKMFEETGAPIGTWHYESNQDDLAMGHPWLSWPFRSGTHYILFQCNYKMTHHELAQAARVSSLGPLGYVFLGGGTATLAEMRKVAVNATPTVLLKNTGGVTQQWALLFDAVKASINTPNSKSPEAIDLLKPVRDGFDETALKPICRMTLPDAVEVMDIFKARPEVFQDTISVVDPLVDSPESVLNSLSLCFSSTATGIVELGAGAAQDDVVLEAWKLQMELDYNARRKKNASDALMFASLVLTFLSTAIAVAITVLEIHEEWRAAISDKNFKILQYLCLVFPALSGLITTIVSRLRLTAKWSILKVGAARIVAEIYFFRTNTGPYNPRNFSRSAAEKEIEQGEDENLDEDDNIGMIRRGARMRFVRIVQYIVKQVGSSDMKGDAMVEPAANQEFKRKDAPILKQHVEMNVLEERLPVYDNGGYTQLWSGHDSPLLPNPSMGTNFDDFVSPLSAETYVEYRLRPVLRRLRAAAPWLSIKLFIIEMMIFLLATIGTLLAALGQREWIPVSVAFGSLCNASLQYLALQTRLEATNSSIVQVQNLLTYWSGVGLVDKRMPAIKEHMVSSLERTILAEAAARAPAAAVMFESEPEEEEKDTNKKDM